MTTWIALLRSVNVGGHNKLAMAQFRTLLSSLGFGDVATYVQSGNAVFHANASAGELAKAIGTAIHKTFGFKTDVLMLTMAELRAAIADNPFPQAQSDPTTLHLFFAAGPFANPDVQAMQQAATNGEEFRLTDRVCYLYTPNGMGRSVLGKKLPRLIAVPVTGRNLRSCHRIFDLAENLAKNLTG